MYDIFYVGQKDNAWLNLKSRFPAAKNVSSIEQAQKKSFTKLFWAVYPDLEITDDWDFSYEADDWSQDYIHMFGNGNFKDGIALHPKKYTPSKKEIEHRFYFNKKIVEITASVPKKFDIFTIDTYADYLDAIEKTTTEMFWGVPSDIDVCSDFDFSFYIPHESTDRNSNHSWLNGNKFDGINLFSKKSPVVEKEISYRFLTNKIEHKTVASNPKPFEQFTIDSYEDYITAKKESKTDMFWGIPSDVDICKDFKFDKTFDNLDTLYRNTNHVFLNNATYDGVVLFSKSLTVSEKEIQHRFYVNKKEWEVVASTPKPYQIFDIETYEEYLAAMDQATGDLFWMSSPNIKIDKDFNFYVSYHEQSDRKQTHAFKHCNEYYNGLFLCSKHKPLTKKEVEYRFPIERQEHNINASSQIVYDKFFVETYEEYLTALEESITELFWVIRPTVDIDNFDFSIYFTHDNEYDRTTNHTFIHDDAGEKLRNSVWLCSKKKPLSKKEVEYKFIINAKEWDIVASKRKLYDKFYINSYEDFQKSLESTSTEMFWVIYQDIEITDENIFNLYYQQKHLHDKENDYDRNKNHSFINLYKDEKMHNGVWLISKNIGLRQKEVEYRFLINAKEHDEVVSRTRLYDKFIIENYEDYETALKETRTELFWAYTRNLKITDPTIFDLHFAKHHMHDDTNKYDIENNHSFVHKVDDQYLRSGVWLLSTHKKLSKKEIEHRFIVNAKEWDNIVSGPTQYDIFNVETYQDYKTALSESKTEMFWMIPSYIDFDDSIVSDVYFPHDNKFDRTINHVYKNGNCFDGATLCSKHSTITEREFNYGFVTHKKEVDITVSQPKPYDVVFISYKEPNADQNYQKLLDKCPNAKRIHGVKGIHQAHIEAAKLCSTPMFWAVDGDAIIEEEFDFDYQVPRWEHDVVHVWRSKNPINELVYGYGGVKLLPTNLTLNVNTTTMDMTTSISNKFKAVEEVSNITAFNTDAFNTWKSAFRESVKLAKWCTTNKSNKKKVSEARKRLEIWTTKGNNKEYGKYCIDGAVFGAEYGTKFAVDEPALRLINDFDWLQKQFIERNGNKQ